MRLPGTFYSTLLALGFLLLSQDIPAQTKKLLSKAAEDSLKVLLLKSKPDTNRVNLLLELGNPVMDRFGKAITNLDTAYHYSNLARRLSKSLHFSKGQILANYRIAYVYLQKEDYDKSREAAKEGIALSNEGGFSELEAEGWHYLGDTYADGMHFLGDIYRASENETIGEKIRCFDKARLLYRETGQTFLEAEMTRFIAGLYASQGNDAMAANLLKKGLDLYASIQYTNVHESLDLLSQAQYRLGNYPEALQWCLKAIKSATALKDSAVLYVYHLNLGNIYQDLKQPKEALFHFNQGQWYLQKMKPTYFSVYTISLITKILIQQGKANEALAFLIKRNQEVPAENIRMKMFLLMELVDTYMGLQDFSQAEKRLMELLRYNEKRPDQDMYKMAVYDKTGHLYLQKKDYEKALYFLNKGVVLNEELKSLNSAVQQQLLLFKVDSARGQLREAIQHYQQYKALNDSIFNEKNSQRIANLQVLHQTIEKEQNIALLTKQNEMQQANLKQKDLHQKLSITGSLLLLLLLGLSYNRYRLKQRSNRLLEAKQQEINHKNQSLQQVLAEKDGLIKDKEDLLLHKDALLEEKEWLLKEIHHRVKNNLQVVMSLLSSQAAYLQDSKALSAIHESQYRVHTISLIHQKLYQSEKVALIEMASYIREVTEYLSDSFNIHQKIKFDLAIVPLELDVTMAVPLGLLINEAITNCLKYAFPGDKTGTVCISISQVDERSYLLTIADDGIGLRQDFDPNVNQTLGMSLIRGLSKQLGGELKIESLAGLQIRVLFTNSFQPKPYAVQV